MKQVTVKSYGRLVSQHRYIVEQRIGRKLKGSELVHHINKDHYDNRPENLMIVSHTEHRRLHRSDIQMAKINGFYRRWEQRDADEARPEPAQPPQSIDCASWLLSINDLVAITGFKKSYFSRHLELERKFGRNEGRPAIPKMFKIGHYRCSLESLLEWIEERRHSHVA